MKTNILLVIIVIFINSVSLSIAGDAKNGRDILQRKSLLNDQGSYIFKTGFPQPFSSPVNLVDKPQVSTGYYFVDSDDDAPDFWRPNPEIVDTSFEASTWKRILPGPRMVDPQYWTDNPGEGLRFFRNPAFPAIGHDFFNGPTDSTDDAIAGPIPLGFDFYFNGIRFDSFYVSTNGIIALTNRRYLYDASGRRVIPNGTPDCYDPMSLDWFVRGHSGDGLNDTTPDNFGYQHCVLNNKPDDSLAGIRARGGALGGVLSPWGSDNRLAIIAPFFGDFHLSQLYPTSKSSEDWGKVFFKRTKSNDKLYIYFVNLAPKGKLKTPNGEYTALPDLRLGDKNYVSCNAQIMLNNIDSSVMIVYERFEGVAVVNGRGVPANTIFRYNTTVGVRGYARHINYGQESETILPWAGEYEQYTHYFCNDTNPSQTFPHNYLAIKFKQWKNNLQICDIQYRVRKTDANANLDFSEIVPSTKANNYEILAGEERIGAIQPVAIIQNLSNNIQGPDGVNYTKQSPAFKVRMRVMNEASGVVVLDKTLKVDSLNLAISDSLSYKLNGANVKLRYSDVSDNNGNWNAAPMAFPGTKKLNGIPPYGFVQVFFPAFEPNEFQNNQIGRLRVIVTAEPGIPENDSTQCDTWPFDDSASVALFSMKRYPDFYDDVSSYHIVNRVPMPSTLKWVNINAEVQSGDEISNHTPPPRGEFAATNNKDFKFDKPDFSTFRMQSPVIWMNRVTFYGGEPVPPSMGDEIRSFPIDLRGRYGALLSMSIQRSIKRDDWPRGWSDQQLIGAEPRTIVNGDVMNVWSYENAASNVCDEISVELMQSSPDGMNQICNVGDSRWRNHPRRGGAKPVTDMAAYSLFGGGGYMRGFLESDKDSALSRPSGKQLCGLRPDIYDDGIDFEFRKVFVAIPDTFISAKNEGAKNFRFRIKVYATNAKKCLSCIPDDDDPFFIRNVIIMFPCECDDVEMSSVRVIWPYTIAPPSQATKIPIIVKLNTITGGDAPSFLVKTRIYRQGDTRPVYCKISYMPFMKPFVQQEIMMPYWNAARIGPGTYRVVSNIIMPGGDIISLNDTTYTDIKLNFGDVIAYDPAQSPRNDVPDNSFTGIPGRGLNLEGFSYGGKGSVLGPIPNYDENNYGAGYVGGSTSGQFAVKFVLSQQDTLLGYKAFFGTLCQGMDDIALSVYSDRNMPDSIIKGSLIYRTRGYDDVRKEPYFDEYDSYLLPKPLVLKSGTYWAAVAQLGETGLELGASKTRMGMRTTNIYIPPPLTVTSDVGDKGTSLVLDKTFRKLNRNSELVNDNYFCYENIYKSRNWKEFMPTVGNPAFGHLHHFGTSPADEQTATLSRGSWIPMLRPYFGQKKWYKFVTDPLAGLYQECDDDLVPVELTYFEGQARFAGIDLLWETSSEKNNNGFYVEKKTGTNPDDEWSTAGFVKGAGTSLSINRYNYLDKDVVSGTTYQYRLRQVDLDGNSSCMPDSKIVTLTYDKEGILTLYQNSPNPMIRDNTVFAYDLPENGNVRLELVNIFGNVVSTLYDGEGNKGRNEIQWSGNNSKGQQVSSGAYVYKLTFGNEVRTGKITIAR